MTSLGSGDVSGDAHKPPREPAFRVPLPVLSLLVVLVGAHAWRVLAHASAAPFSLASQDLAEGHWTPLVTHMFVHGSWAHVLLNALCCLAFGPPVARLLGDGVRGFVLFWLFFLLCGVLAAAGFAVLEPHGEWLLLGASGAASGLVGAASRLLPDRSRPGPLWARPVIVMTLGWVVANVVFGLSGLTPGAAGIPVAWQAHILGFLAGLLLVGPFAWAADLGRPRALEA